jgi:hypothetical protein
MQGAEVQPMAQLPVEVIPVDADGLPALGQRGRGTATLIAADLVLVNLETEPQLPALVVGVRTGHDLLRYFGIDVQTTSRLSTGEFQVQGQVGGLADALLQPKNLTPRFHFDTMTFTFGFAASVLHRWEAAGVLQSVVIDRLLLCPRCHGLPTFRHGCRNCGSGRVHRLPLDCGDAKPTNGISTALANPQSRSVQVQTKPRFAYRCAECQGEELELVPVNQCLHCDHRFAADEGYELVLRGYRVARLDLLGVNHRSG